MGLLDDTSRVTDQADLVILNHVEILRDQMQPATASAVASFIGGAPTSEIAKRMHRLVYLGCLDVEPMTAPLNHRLTLLGAELLVRDLPGWLPSEREQRRREAKVLEVLAYPRRNHR